MRGMLRSEIIKSGSPARSFPSASRPSTAVRTTYPADTKYPERSLRIRGSSSTNKTRSLSCPTMFAPQQFGREVRVLRPGQGLSVRPYLYGEECLRGRVPMLALYTHHT